MKSLVGVVFLGTFVTVSASVAQLAHPPRSPETIVLRAPLPGGRQLALTVREAALMAADAEGFLSMCADAIRRNYIGQSFHASALQEGRDVLGPEAIEQRIAAARKKGRGGCADIANTLKAKPETNILIEPRHGV